jgi:methylmalonyl-CoA mutase C-terminal domain/subunit
LKEAGLEDVGVFVGGIIPEVDVPRLMGMGVLRVFGPGTTIDAVVQYFRAQGGRRRAPV